MFSAAQSLLSFHVGPYNLFPHRIRPQNIPHNTLYYHFLLKACVSPYALLERLEKGGYTYITDYSTFKLARKKSCSYVAVRDMFLGNLPYSMALQNNSAYKAEFDKA